MATTRLEEEWGIIAIRSHLLLGSSICRLGEAHEKGLVENLVGYVRRNFLVLLLSISSFGELNAILGSVVWGVRTDDSEVAVIKRALEAELIAL